jgi:hypothetical protein
MNKNKLTLYDQIKRVKKEKSYSKWIGTSGDTYIFKHLDNGHDKSKPLVQVIKDRKFLTGLFRTKEPGTFSGDVRINKKKTFLLFEIKGKKNINIYSKTIN